MLFPKPLQPGDLIAIVAPAKAIESSYIEFASNLLIEKGFRVKVGKHATGTHHYFSGSIEERLHDFHEALNDEAVKAILCARGGYGCVQLVDRISWGMHFKDPKWILGFSDVTVFHQHHQRNGIASIHSSMPLNFQENSVKALDTLIDSITGKLTSIQHETSSFALMGNATGTLMGGNLSIVYSLLGTDSQPNYENTILFIEDLAEQHYAIDRMFHALAKAGILDQINGLVVGGMTKLTDTATPFGMTYQEIIKSHFEYRKKPVAFDFPAGHIDDNRSLVLGAQVQLSVDANATTLTFDY